jgi:hypothetical protein
MVTITIGIITALSVLLAASCMVLARLTDYEAAGSAGCVEEGQVW